jgi:hypothetical protein
VILGTPPSRQGIPQGGPARRRLRPAGGPARPRAARAQPPHSRIVIMTLLSSSDSKVMITDWDVSRRTARWVAAPAYRTPGGPTSSIGAGRAGALG